MPTLHEINKILKAHKPKLREKYKVKEIGIFGSFVRGEEKKRAMWIFWSSTKNCLTC